MGDRRREEDYPFKILVEGPDDKFVIANLRERNHLEDNFFIKDCGSVEKAIEVFRISINQQASKNKRLGIVIDADTNLPGRWQRITQILTESNRYKAPKELPSNGLMLHPIDPDDPIIGVWIMPDNNLNGMLEDFLAMLAVNDQTLFKEAELILTGIETKGIHKYKKTHRSKALIHTFLAWQEEPGVSMGNAIAKSYLQADSEMGISFTNWIKDLFT